MVKDRGIVSAALAVSLLLGSVSSPGAQEKGGPPPALVAVSEVREGMVVPRTKFVGTVYYPEVSEVSAEVSGSVLQVAFDEGQRIRKGEVLVFIDADLLEKTLASTRALHGQTLADLEKATLDLNRIEKLYREDSIAEQVYDETRFRVKSLEKKGESLQADVERLELERSKKAVRAPFDGVVLKKTVDRGEWLSPGTAIGTLARDDTMDVIVEIPGDVVPFVSKGGSVQIRAAGKEIQGRVKAIVPKGEITTRTFPVKIEVRNRYSLIEGMEAVVEIPSGPKERALLVPRDALVTVMGRTVVFTVVEGRAKMVPVTVSRYLGKEVAVRTDGLRPGMEVLIKGNERVRDGQPVRLVTGQGGSPEAVGKGEPPR
ncbi:MAG TPA: efflux RND transporter periplasmic adaptor subunit [Candidatus Deferrimicrobiaceae bacterium]|nr:efflux RND transporter periplasmic adaptor subunit [Candidatus Deferrimicrobiaceae bacterium]